MTDIFISPTKRTIILDGGQPWGIRLQGGFEFAQQLRIAKVNSNGKAYKQGIQPGDIVTSINGQTAERLTYSEATQMLHDIKDKLKLELIRTDRNAAITIPVNKQSISNGIADYFQNSLHQGQKEVKDYKPIHFVVNRKKTFPFNCDGDSNFSPILNVQEKSLDSKCQDSSLLCNKSCLTDKGIQSYSDSHTTMRSSVKFSKEPHKSYVRCHPRIKSDLGFSNFQESKITNFELQSDKNSSIVKPPSFTSTNEFQKHYGPDEMEENTIYCIKKRTIFPNHLQTVQSLPSSPQMKRVKFAPIPPCSSQHKEELKDCNNEMNAPSFHKQDLESEKCQDITTNHTENNSNSTSESKISAENASNSLIETNISTDSTAEIKIFTEKAANSEDELSHKDWYKQVFKALHKIDQQPELTVYLIDNVENAIPPRPKQDKKRDDSDVVQVKNPVNQKVQEKLKDKKTIRKEQRSKSLPDKETVKFDVNLPNLEIHRTFQKIELDIKEDNKLKNAKKKKVPTATLR